MHVGYAFSTFVLQPLGMSQVALLIYCVGVAFVFWIVVAAIAVAAGGHLARQPLQTGNVKGVSA